MQENTNLTNKSPVTWEQLTWSSDTATASQAELPALKNQCQLLLPHRHLPPSSVSITASLKAPSLPKKSGILQWKRRRHRRHRRNRAGHHWPICERLIELPGALNSFIKAPGRCILEISELHHFSSSNLTPESFPAISGIRVGSRRTISQAHYCGEGAGMENVINSSCCLLKKIMWKFTFKFLWEGTSSPTAFQAGKKISYKPSDGKRNVI